MADITQQVPLLGAIDQLAVQPLKRMFKGAPQDRFATDLGVADAMPDPTQRGQKLIGIKQQMLDAGYQPQDIAPVLRPRGDMVLGELQRTGNANAVLAMERAFGRVPATRASTVGTMMRVPGQIESESALTGQRQAGTYHQLQAGNLDEARRTQLVPAQAAQAGTAAQRNVAQAGLAGTREEDVKAKQQPSINETLARTKLLGAQTEKAKAPGKQTGQLTEADIYKQLATLAAKLGTGTKDTDAAIRQQMADLEARKPPPSAEAGDVQPVEPVTGIGMSTPGGGVEPTDAPMIAPPQPAAAPAMTAPPPAAKRLTPQQAQQFLQQAGGDKNKARQLARQAGFTF